MTNISCIWYSFLAIIVVLYVPVNFGSFFESSKVKKLLKNWFVELQEKEKIYSK